MARRHPRRRSAPREPHRTGDRRAARSRMAGLRRHPLDRAIAERRRTRRGARRRHRRGRSTRSPPRSIPICRSITGDGVRETLGDIARRTSRSSARGADGHAGLRLDGPARVEHPRRLHQERARRARRRLPPIQPARAELQRAGPRAHAARGAEEPHLHAAGSARPDPLPHLLLRRALGLLHGARAALAALPEGDLRGRDRFEPRRTERSPTANTCIRGRDGGRSAALGPHLPSLAGQRQLLRARAADASGRAHLARGERATATASCSRPARSARSPGSRATSDRRRRIKHGLVLSCVGDGGGPTYKKSRRGDAEIDRAMAHVAAATPRPSPTVLDFFALRLRRAPVLLARLQPAGRACSSAASSARFPNITPRRTISTSSGRSISAASYRHDRARRSTSLEANWRLRNTAPKGEPQLGERGLYGAIGGDKDAAAKNMAMLWVLNLSDGEHSLLDIAERAGTAVRSASLGGGAAARRTDC